MEHMANKEQYFPPEEPEAAARFWRNPSGEVAMTDISVFRDTRDPRDWIVEDNDADGDSAVLKVIFTGYQAELHARAYSNWLQANRIKGAHPWWPIALAPKDGEEIALLCWLDDDAGYIMRRGCWGAGMWWNLEAGEPTPLEVLAWVPLPSREDRENVRRGA
jgi:hypothetical protein